MTELAVFVLSYNRPVFLLEALQSIQAQDFADFKIIVSDNSTTEDVTDLFSKHPLANVEFRRRLPSLSISNHFNCVLNEAQSYPYFMMFHDDDIMLPKCLSVLMSEIKKQNTLAAISCNAFIKTETESEKLFNSHLKLKTLIANPKELITRYLNSKLSHTPFPFYIYRSEKVKSIAMDFTEAGKNSDLTFLCKVTGAAPIHWLPEPLALYRRHAANDSNDIVLTDLVRLAGFIFKRYRSHYFAVSVFLIKSCVKKLVQKLKF